VTPLPRVQATDRIMKMAQEVMKTVPLLTTEVEIAAGMETTPEVKVPPIMEVSKGMEMVERLKIGV
jgi:hypothetical protein